LQHDVPGPRVLQVQREAALAGVAVGEVAAAVDALDLVLEGRSDAKAVEPLAALDLDHVGAGIGQHLRCEGTGTDPGEIGDANPLERSASSHHRTPAPAAGRPPA